MNVLTAIANAGARKPLSRSFRSDIATIRTAVVVRSNETYLGRTITAFRGQQSTAIGRVPLAVQRAAGPFPSPCRRQQLLLLEFRSQ